MTVQYTDATVTLHHGDCLAVLRELPGASVDSIVTDPPYGLGFMGKAWDDLPPGEDWARECLRVLKPGGHLLAFGGTRTWHRLAVAVEDAGFEVRDSIAWLYGSGFPKSLDVSKAIDKAAGAEREVVGTERRPYTEKDGGGFKGDRAFPTDAEGYAVNIITAPATDEARTWEGWGTALKPAHEPVVVARKPLSHLGILATIGSHLSHLETAWPAPEADPTTPTGAEAGSPARTGTSPSGSVTPTSSNTVTSWRKCWDEICELTSTSTTSTASETTTALKTLSSSLSKLTAESTPKNPTSQHGWTSTVTAVDNLFASVVCGLRATLALSAAEPATASTPPDSLDVEGSSPAFEPVVVARKPLTGTVAANVLAHGVGALNIDGCRVEHGGDVDLTREQRQHSETAGFGSSGMKAGHVQPLYAATGRWPANVTLDESQAAELDTQSGNLTSNGGKGPHTIQGTAARNANRSAYGDYGPSEDRVYGDSGGASRFFYVAKADASERVRISGTAHPTVKPLALMRWLVRLVTPPGGTVLEPFAGSGTTVEACILEGLRCIAIEREADYLPLIVQRVNRRRDPVAAVADSGEDGGLFDLLNEETA